MTNKEFSIFYNDYLQSVRKKGISIDTTNKCPLLCPWCIRQHEIEREKIRKSYDLLFGELETMLKFTNRIRFCGQISDPIYHPQFLNILESLKRYPKTTFSIHTNGTRKKIEWWESAFKLTTKNIRWVFGLDGTDQETANIHRVNTRFDEVLSVMKMGASLNKKIVWQFIVFKHNEHQIEVAKDLCREYNIILELITTDKWSNPIPPVTKVAIEKPSDEWFYEENNFYMKKYIFIKPE